MKFLRRSTACAGFAVLALALLGGCGKKAAPEVDPAVVVQCSKDPRVQAYAANMRQAGSSGLLSFVLVQAAPAPPGRDENTWTVRVQDAAGNAVTGANLAVKLWMPDHGHGPATIPTISASGADIQVQNMDFFMAGVWQITLTATAAGQSDSAVFTFCVEG